MSIVFEEAKLIPLSLLKKKSSVNLIPQIYIDGIIFGSFNAPFCKELFKFMQNEFEMSMMGELTFFLPLQIHQSNEDTFVCQSKYTKELIKKIGMKKALGTPTSSICSLENNDEGKLVKETKYRGIIGLFYI